MSARHPLGTQADRLKAAAAAVAVNFVLGLALITGLALRDEHRREEMLETFDVALPPPPPRPPVMEKKATEKAEQDPEGAAGKKSEPSPVVAPPAPLPRPTPVVAAPTPGTGSAASSGKADRGSGTGAGGSGSGSGGGSGAGGIGSEARLLGGNRSRLPSRMLRDIPQPRGYAHLLLSVGVYGKVTACEVLTSSGFDVIDQALCRVMIRSSIWQPARDRAGQPITVQVRYTATWSKD